MPGIASHIVLMDRVTASVSSSSLKQILQKHPRHAAWGAIGPDAFYFHPPDWGALGDFFEFIYELEEKLREVVNLYRRIEEVHEQVENFLSGGVYLEIKRTTAAVMVTLQAALFKALSDQVDVFKLFEPPLARLEPVEKWWWVDILHHHRSGDFARSLWHHAGTEDALKAYCLGYFSHIAGDVAVHPYVNVISGGPFRLHGRRHVFIEKCFDTHILDKWNGVSISDSALHERIRFSANSTDIPELPDRLAELVVLALRDTYGLLGIKSGVPDHTDLKIAYRFFFKWLEGTTSLGGLNLPEPPDFDILKLPKEILELLTPPPSVAFPQKPLESLNDWVAFLASILAFITWAIQSVIALTALAYSVLKQLSTLPLRYLLWLIQRFIYEIYDKVRLALAAGAHLHPERHHLAYFRSVVHPQYSQLLEYKYPFAAWSNTKQTYHLVHPAQVGVGQEEPAALPASAYKGQLSGISGPSFGDVESPLVGDSAYPANDPLFAVCQAPDPVAVEQLIQARREFRSARTLCLDIYKDFENTSGESVPNWNLDADRGFTWPAWDWLKSPPWSAGDFEFHCK